MIPHEFHQRVCGISLVGYVNPLGPYFLVRFMILLSLLNLVFPELQQNFMIQLTYFFKIRLSFYYSDYHMILEP